jgi:hypothetical protein
MRLECNIVQYSSHQLQLESALIAGGWQVVDRCTELDWWADEVWTIESTWSPSCVRAFVTFLVDPQANFANRKTGETVWAVGCYDAWPSRRDTPVIVQESLTHWHEKLPVLVAGLAHFRDSKRKLE